MSVIIKGLNKFHSCRLCPFNNSDCYCNITKGIIDRDDYSCESECPIVQLPKGHGRIADMDAAIKCIEDVTGDDAFYAITLIDWACGKRTIIEADKESER